MSAVNYGFTRLTIEHLLNKIKHTSIRSIATSKTTIKYDDKVIKTLFYLTIVLILWLIMTRKNICTTDRR